MTDPTIAWDAQTLHLEEDGDTLWVWFTHPARPAFDWTSLKELDELASRVLRHTPDRGGPLRFIVFGSRMPRVFHLGGDLEVFSQWIREGDATSLEAYGHACLNGVMRIREISARGVTLLALLEGNALGGGLEAALAMDFVVLERGSRVGFPEVRFNLFPGMGALPLLLDRMDPIRARRVLTSGRLFGADEALQEGIVDRVVDKGRGRAEVEQWIEALRADPTEKRLSDRGRRVLTPEALRRDVDAWARRALGLEPADLQLLDELVQRQHNLKNRLLLQVLKLATRWPWMRSVLPI